MIHGEHPIHSLFGSVSNPEDQDKFFDLLVCTNGIIDDLDVFIRILKTSRFEEAYRSGKVAHPEKFNPEHEDPFESFKTIELYPTKTPPDFVKHVLETIDLDISDLHEKFSTFRTIVYGSCLNYDNLLRSWLHEETQ